jgi:hypothetical protein
LLIHWADFRLGTNTGVKALGLRQALAAHTARSVSAGVPFALAVNAAGSDSTSASSAAICSR